ncbi:MAG TPA: AAA family ATPase [Verrucomicrobiae bacterium]|nr:AAA family ATPase [Verrucomicrobiae bacterium]
MANDIFQLFSVTRAFGDEAELAEALGFPEVSALHDAERKWRSCLQSKAKAVLEDAALSPTISLHRRKLLATVELDSLELIFEPPRRSPDWEQPVPWRVHFVRWAEDELHHAFVPGLGVHVFATRAALLAGRVEAHVRLLLAGRGRRLTLRRLAELARVTELRLSQLEVTAQRKTPKQIAVAGEAVEETKSVMDKLAEELPPTLPRPDDAGKSASPDARATTPVAFELDAELRQLAEALAGPHRRSVLIVGAPGGGKSALVRELARRRRDYGFGHTPFWSTSGARLMTGPIGFGMWQERCQQMCREVSKSQAILHLNNLGELLEVGKASRGAQSVGSFLRPWIARGEVLAIAECTPEQVSVIERNEPHLLGAFQQLHLAERSPEQTRAILGHVLATAPGKDATDASASGAALARLHQLHQRYATYSANPGRPLRFLKNLLADQFPERQINEVQVIAAFSRETGLPAVLLDDDVPLEFSATREWFARRVIGQPEAAERVVDLLLVIKARLARPRKPLASFLFIGPTGTGKTEMAKALAGFLFGDPARLVRFDLNEFNDPLAVQRLIGGPATGDAEGLLTARIREQPFSVVLLDEFEKADPSFFDLLLQILGDGRLTDAAGRVADFCNSVIVMTSNLGAAGFQHGAVGFRAEGTAPTEAREHFADAVRQFLRPEIYNRLDAIVPFQALTPETVLAIARRHLDLLRQRDGVRLRAIEWQMQPEVAGHLAARGYDVRYGARPLKRAIERELLVPLAEALNQFRSDTALQVNLGVADGCIHIQVRAQTDQSNRLREETTDQLATRIMVQRRHADRLEHCVATGRIEDEVAMLESLERRLKAAQWKTPALQERLAKLPKLRECLLAVATLAKRARQLETEALGLLYQREVFDDALFTPELHAVASERLKLMRVVFRSQLEQPDEVVLAFYSEHRETLLEFAAAYHGLGGELGAVLALDYFLPPPGVRSSATKLLRETPKKLDAFFTSPPEKLIGIVLHLRGDLFLPRLQPEAGLHVLKEKRHERICLIESAPPPFVAYEPPAGIERQGAIATRGASSRRRYEQEKGVVEDNIIGERPWASLDVRRIVAELSAQRLDRAIEEATK